MKKPVDAIERMRKFYTRGYMTANFSSDEGSAILAYLDSLKPWPADLTRERLIELASNGEAGARSKTLRRLAELAPEREKRMVEIWEHKNGAREWHDMGKDYSPELGWRKVGGPFEIEG